MTAPGAQEYGDRVEIRVRGGMMPVWLIGEEPPLLLLHGISANHTEWLSVARLTPWTNRTKMLDALVWSLLRTSIRPIAGICRRPLTHYILTRRVYGGHHPNMTDAVSRYSAPQADRSLARADSPTKSRTCMRGLLATSD